MHTRLHLFDKIHSIIQKYFFTILDDCFLFKKAEFSASLFQSSVSYDPSEIIIIC